MSGATGGAAAACAALGSAHDEIDASTGVEGARTPGRLRRLARVGAVAALLLAVAACSSIRLGYNNADTLLLYSLDRYFDLDDAQEELARERVRGLLAWHRTTQLADYAQLLEDAQRRIEASDAAPLAAGDILAMQAEVNARLVALGHRAAPDLARLATSLTPAQLARFAGRLEESNTKLRKERAVDRGVDAAAHARLERSLERARDWLGTLTPAQEALLRTAIAERPDAEQRWLAERERRQRVLLALLERLRSERPSPEVGAAWIHAYIAELVEPADPQRRAAVLAMREANARLIAQLLNSATPPQKAALGKRLRGYTEDFMALAGQGARS